jgi:hypothetical protein
VKLAKNNKAESGGRRKKSLSDLLSGVKKRKGTNASLLFLAGTKFFFF